MHTEKKKFPMFLWYHGLKIYLIPLHPRLYKRKKMEDERSDRIKKKERV